MAITKSQIKGIHTKTLMNMSYDKWKHYDKTALKYAVDRLSKTANSRLRKFKEINMKSPATEWAKRSGGKFTSKNKSFKQMQTEFVRVKSFLEQETSTIEGYEDVKQRVKDALMEHDVKIDTDEYSTLWETYDKLYEKNPWIAEKGMKYKVIAKLNKRIESHIERYGEADKDTLARSMRRTLKRLYEKYSSSLSKKVTGTSQFFK